MAKSINTRNLTKHLNVLGMEAHDVLPDGTPMSREEKLARLLWDRALGYEEETRDADGNRKTIKHKPEAWAMQYIYERKEGKTTPAPQEDNQRIKASDRVRELAQERLNQIAKKVAVPLVAKGPPPFKGKK